MAYVIAEPCIDTKDNSCVEVCPVDCIHPTPEEPGYDEQEMLYIDPDDPASQAIRHAARGLIALTPAAPIPLPVLEVVQTGPPQPVGMSLPMA